MAGGYSVSTAVELQEARQLVLEWLRGRRRSSGFMEEMNAAEVAAQHTDIAKTFLAALEGSGFAVEIVQLEEGPPAMFEGRWTHYGAAFIGFRQPPAAQNPEDAALLACAALLRNDWCRSKLPAETADA